MSQARKRCDPGECGRFDWEVRIAKLEAAAWDLIKATIPSGMGTIRLPDNDANRAKLDALGRVLRHEP